MTCEHCHGPGNETDGVPYAKCCWSRAMEIKKFQKRVKYKYIIEVTFDLIVSVTSVVTDILTLFMYFYKRKWEFAILTLFPILLPTLIFTNVYLVDESMSKSRKAASRLISTAAASRSSSPVGEKARETSRGKKEEEAEAASEDTTSETDSNIQSVHGKQRCHQNWLFHCPGCRKPIQNTKDCFSGCMLCLCNRDHEIRRVGARAIRKSMQRMFKYGFGTFVLRFIAWAWYIKALIFGIKAYREPKRFMKIETPNNHWSYELLVRLDFLQAALENAPQCVIQLYALITQPDEDIALGVLTLIFSFVDFIRVSVSVHWDMDKGPVIAPSGCYDTWMWKFINTSSWILIYSARSAAIALITATATLTKGSKTIIPCVILLCHVVLFGKLLSKAEYGVAAQKVFIAVFISLFFLPELDSSVIPAIIQFYYATTIIENAIFILPWEGFDKEYCFSRGRYVDRRPPPQNRTTTSSSMTTVPTRIVTLSNLSDPTTPSTTKYMAFGSMGITPEITTPEAPVEHADCLIDPTIITLAVPTLTIIGVIFRLVASQKMANYKGNLPSNEVDKAQSQNKLETSIANLFNKKWTQMSVNQMFTAFLRMLKKEVIILDKDFDEEDDDGHLQVIRADPNNPTKRVSFLAAKLQAEFLASQTFIRESFSLMTRTTRSHDIGYFGKWGGGEQVDEEEIPPEYSSDSELTIRNNIKKRPRIPRSRNVSESVDVVGDSAEAGVVQVEMPTGTQYLEMCWV